ncbi:MAG TPA: putative quinol monooxygenase [Croceibacterium sp.]|nr:putative quinol monooxygenase [Croceibacterium sp.]
MDEIYGLIGQIRAVPGKREELVTLLLQGSKAMPGNLAYIVAEDLADPDSIWITEVWQTRTDHANSLNLPAVQQAIAQARPLIAGFGARAETRPIGFAG